MKSWSKGLRKIERRQDQFGLMRERGPTRKKLIRCVGKEAESTLNGFEVYSRVSIEKIRK